MPDQELKLEGRKIILGITGSISAYKSAFLLRLLVKSGAQVQVLMTESATSFVGPLSFSTLSQRPVLTYLAADQQWAKHVELGLWADLMVIAPASAQTIAKMAHGLTDNLLTAVYLSAKCPVMIAPAMDLDMWNHPATQNNIRTLDGYGHQIIPVGDGPLASGLTGPGRLAEPEFIYDRIVDFFYPQLPLKGKRVLVTAGPTKEALDPVRYLGNHSSGKMGIRIAEEAARMGAQVDLILGPSTENVAPVEGLEITRIESAQDMFEAVEARRSQTDIFILAAAVADFKPARAASEKIKKAEQILLQLELVPTVDIAAHIGARKSAGQLVCGFALETENPIENATVKRRKKNMDLIVINSPRVPGAAFGHDTNQISILDNSEKLISFDLKTKKEVARDILRVITEHVPA